MSLQSIKTLHSTMHVLIKTLVLCPLLWCQCRYLCSPEFQSRKSVSIAELIYGKSICLQAWASVIISMQEARILELGGVERFCLSRLLWP